MCLLSLQVFKVKAMILKDLHTKNHIQIALSAAPGSDLDDKILDLKPESDAVLDKPLQDFRSDKCVLHVGGM